MKVLTKLAIAAAGLLGLSACETIPDQVSRAYDACDRQVGACYDSCQVAGNPRDREVCQDRCSRDADRCFARVSEDAERRSLYRASQDWAFYGRYGFWSPYRGYRYGPHGRRYTYDPYGYDPYGWGYGWRGGDRYGYGYDRGYGRGGYGRDGGRGGYRGGDGRRDGDGGRTPGGRGGNTAETDTPTPGDERYYDDDGSVYDKDGNRLRYGTKRSDPTRGTRSNGTRPAPRTGNPTVRPENTRPPAAQPQTRPQARPQTQPRSKPAPAKRPTPKRPSRSVPRGDDGTKQLD